MNPFNIHVPTEVRFGEGVVKRDLAGVIARFRLDKFFVVTDPGLVKVGVIDVVLSLLRQSGYDATVFSDVEPDPSVDTVHRVASEFLKAGAGLLLAVGGGSSIDTAKGARVIVSQGGHIRDYAGLRAQPVADTRQIPLVAIPTTSGTGSEVTFFGVYSDWENNLKVTVTSPFLAPTAALVDSSFTHSVPPHVTASSGIDVLAHAVEA
ncbi:MAG TPA: iron-containing alcohol dehydrogenase, partial [Alicyclobacillus sp.]|nr:iron-containing alcohol dehydrogenase [Alicyclobacillus sp.]